MCPRAGCFEELWAAVRVNVRRQPFNVRGMLTLRLVLWPKASPCAIHDGYWSVCRGSAELYTYILLCMLSPEQIRSVHEIKIKAPRLKLSSRQSCSPSFVETSSSKFLFLAFMLVCCSSRERISSVGFPVSLLKGRLLSSLGQVTLDLSLSFLACLPCY